ncbi:peptidoglycan-binding domain-containing protein [Myxococcus sp. SDU36]|uniref:peptidoglycan-binding domain-containing protein n=1 Tax=Myxococcus sp. SDU36 TaxID=2831967 RepID=UPI00254353E9|nr:peptidoglycan-binding domain-containing protein [Myxococcus sp. SDU36]WIG94820.1 peptidoglycan-binding protein [Myxococcus sp. SDU36]
MRLAVKDADGQSMDGSFYELETGREVFSGILKTFIEHAVPVDTEMATLRVWKDAHAEVPGLVWRLRVGHLDPIDTVSGIQGRLRNLGFGCGPIDGIAGPLTEAAVRAFQRNHGLSVDGVVGPLTRARLVEVHGC